MAEKNSLNIAFLDSGVGGLSILDAVATLLPNENYIYLADYFGFPYGHQPEDALLKRLDKVCTFLVDLGIDVLVVACNTASTMALPHLRGKFAIPIVGVIPPVKLAAKMSQSRTIGLLATAATVKRPYTLKLIEDFASDCGVISVGSSYLVEAAEAKLLGYSVDLTRIDMEMQEFRKSSSVDVIALSCTHFSHLVPEFLQLGLGHIQFVSPSEGVAQQVGRVLAALRNDKPNLGHGKAKEIRAFCTDHVSFSKEKKAELASLYERRHMKVEWVTL